MSEVDCMTRAVAGLIDTLRDSPQGVPDEVRINRIRVLEELKSAAAAAQARETAAYAASQKQAQRAAGVREKQLGLGIPGAVGLARRISPFQAARYTGWAAILTSELPHTFAALQAGKVSEWRAMIVAKETIWLSRAHRASVDAELAPKLEGLGDRRVEAEARRLGYRLDPLGYLDRFAAAVNDRHVSIRPAPDAMTRLTALLPVAQGVAAYAALACAADTSTATGDERGRGQIMADTLVERLTGQAAATDVPLAVNLIITDQTLLDGGAESAQVEGHGPIPGELARRLISEASESTGMWLRRLFAHPESGQLVAMETRQRFFTPAQRAFIRLRDQACRTPWCDAPIRHADHVIDAAHGGPTRLDHGQGYCQACNHAKQAPGWQTIVIDDDRGTHEVETVTPTGHRYRSRAPDPPRRTRLREAGQPCRPRPGTALVSRAGGGTPAGARPEAG